LIETAPKEEVAKAKKVEGVAEEAEEEEEKEAEETVPEAEEEEKKEKRKKEAEEEEIVEERIYTIPLRRVWISPRKKRAPRAVRVVKSFIQRHMKVETGIKAGDEEEEEARLVISNEVNEKLWSRGIEKPPRNIRVRAVKDKEGTVTVYLAEGD
jgi:large subunit ribosomal protein L31e